ncbi:MAG: transketolase, partial [Clostridia bacterium]|nr:transketolase [Clostridia bacterium]
MDQSKKLTLKRTANNVRLGIIEAVYNAACGHPGGSLSIADVLTYLYFAEMNIDPANPAWEERDRFVLSKGHTAPALYSVLAERGFFPKEELKTLRKTASRLQGHPDMKGVPGVDMSTGSLGLGFSTACGMALSAKVSGDSYRVYAAVGDGESEEGQVWEAAMFAAHYKLDNLTLVVDLNGLQIDGPITEVMNPMPHDEKFRAFGWHVIVINAHSFSELEAAFAEAKTVKGKPT